MKNIPKKTGGFVNKFNFTQGPWMAWDTGHGISICPADCANDLIPNVSALQNEIVRFKAPQPWNDEAWAEIKANSILAAAAPELLEALEDIGQLATDIMNEPDAEIRREKNALINGKALRAISKARGEK